VATDAGAAGGDVEAVVPGTASRRIGIEVVAGAAGAGAIVAVAGGNTGLGVVAIAAAGAIAS
jgi:hypothetical protein